MITQAPPPPAPPVRHTAPPRNPGVPPRRTFLPKIIPPWKRALDIALILLSLPIVLPICLFIALGVVIISPGPIFYGQERVGYRGRRFKLWKYRSMRVSKGGDAERVHKDHTTELMRNGQAWAKMDGRDPRVIPLGRLLRATGLDELPQLFNVFKGDMSIVGPRPGTPYEVNNYLPWQEERLEALPGLTGLWQVTGKGRTNFVEMVQLDIDYVRKPSLWADLKIMAKTVPTVIGQVRGIFRKNLEKKQSPRS